MEYFRHMITNAKNLHTNMGRDLAQHGGVLRCRQCGHEQSLNAEQIAHYLAHGWPKHCGQGMSWVTQRELDDEARRDAGE